MKDILKTALAVAGVLVLVSAAGLLWSGYSLKKSLEPRVNPALYPGIVKARIGRSEHYGCLPPRIPEDATRAAFFHLPGFLQGSDVIALRVSLPGERATSVLKDLEASGREEIRDFQGVPAPNAYPEYGLKKPGPDDVYAGVSELPADFRIFLYKSDMEDIRNNWNHNILAFTAVSTQRQEVVYFIENW